MKLLLDTCTFLWMALDSPELSPKVRALVLHEELYLSVASVWEMCAKHAAGRLPLPEPPSTWVPSRRAAMRVQSLPLEEECLLQWTRLPALHEDRYDRLLICQSIAHGFPLLTPDPLIHQYPVRTIW